MKQWYEELFENSSNSYEEEVFVKGTIGEVDFIEREINYDKSKNILDIGCGTGRHSIELTKRGYSVTGFDLSKDQIAKAKEKAEAASLKIQFEVNDARTFNYKEQFHLAIMMCEGSFPLMETDEMNFSILQNAYNSLGRNGKFIFTTLNGLFPLFHSVKDFINSEDREGRNKENSFDLMTFRDHSLYEMKDDFGNTKYLKCNERYYVPSEITWLLKSIGFINIEIFGAKLGAFDRQDKLTTEDFEMLVIANKE